MWGRALARPGRAEARPHISVLRSRDACRGSPLRNPVRRAGCRTIRKSSAGVRTQGVSEQDLAQPQLRRGCRAAAQAHAGVLWLLRLAFIRSRTLASCTVGANIPRRAVHTARTPGVERESDCG